MTTVINLWGQPNAGKSTCAFGLCHFMKSKGYDVEFVPEYCKELTWAKDYEALSDQWGILDVQEGRIAALNGKVEYVVTDSPFTLGIIYNTNEDIQLNAEIINRFNSYTNLNFLLKKDSKKPYNPKGRNQTEEQSAEIAEKIETLAESFGIHKTLVGDMEAPHKIIEFIEKRKKLFKYESRGSSGEIVN